MLVGRALGAGPGRRRSGPDNRHEEGRPVSRYELEIHVDHHSDEVTVTAHEVAEDQHRTLIEETTVSLDGRDAAEAVSDIVADLPL